MEAPASGEARDLLDALARLGRREREALLLFEVGGFSVDEVRALQGDRSAGAVSPSDPGLSDADLQAILDGVAGVPGPDRPRIERLPDGRRAMVRYGSAVVLAEGVRLWIRPDHPTGRPIRYDGVRDEHMLLRTDDGWRPMADVVREHRGR